MNSKKKGKTGELEIAHILRDYGYNARRGQQFSGANGDADVVGLPGIHIEVKRVEKLNIHDAIAQAAKDAYPDSLRCGCRLIPAVFHRRNRTEWLVTMTLDDWMKLYKKGATNGSEEGEGDSQADHGAEP